MVQKNLEREKSGFQNIYMVWVIIMIIHMQMGQNFLERKLY
ncbi:MAG: DUF4044 domain-containing protein [Lachnospiraceae bacterium]|nr:DUF4044 domain-containing protein [Lachnospiraceae bacterium]MCI9369786.1 DUF4044 domain-containing protein [Lachnospiraceae bacterium]MDE7307318.1 DUF4044 domain-containing protein [Lachnospiraceae bacterium]